MKLHPGEPPAGPWRIRPLGDVARYLIDQASGVSGRPVVIAIDGRSASGKSTFADRMRRTIRNASVVHTDEIAWYESFFGWDELIADGVLARAHRGEAVSFRPPAWDLRDRPGAVEVPAPCAVLLVEGVGIARQSLMKFHDVVVWVQSDVDVARVRGLARDGESAAEIAFWDEWDAAEVPFQAHERPWERADLIVAGTTAILHSPDTEVVAATGFLSA